MVLFMNKINIGIKDYMNWSKKVEKTYTDNSSKQSTPSKGVSVETVHSPKKSMKGLTNPINTKELKVLQK